MDKPRIAALGLSALFWPVAAFAATQRVPVVTQVQGAVFYRTFLTIGNASASPMVSTTLTLTYRSPADGSIQAPVMHLDPLAAGQAVTFDDVIQTFKDAGAIRAQDSSAGLFGTLTVSPAGASPAFSVVARTYSPGSGGGTNGIAYVGRDTSAAGTKSKLVAFVSNGSFGPAGTTRANIAVVNEGGAATDVRLTYFDASTGVALKQFTLSSLAGHALAPGEVVQVNNVFSSVPASTTLMRIEAAPTAPVAISGYAVQLDSVTNDGSFFLMTEEP